MGHKNTRGKNWRLNSTEPTRICKTGTINWCNCFYQTTTRRVDANHIYIHIITYKLTSLLYLNHLYLVFIFILFLFWWIIICFALPSTIYDFLFLFENSYLVRWHPSRFAKFFWFVLSGVPQQHLAKGETPFPFAHQILFPISAPRAICCKGKGPKSDACRKKQQKSSLSHTNPPNRLGGSPTRPRQPRPSCSFGHRSLASCSLHRCRSFLRYAEVNRTLRRTSTPKPNPKLGWAGSLRHLRRCISLRYAPSLFYSSHNRALFSLLQSLPIPVVSSLHLSTGTCHLVGYQRTIMYHPARSRSGVAGYPSFGTTLGRSVGLHVVGEPRVQIFIRWVVGDLSSNDAR